MIDGISLKSRSLTKDADIPSRAITWTNVEMCLATLRLVIDFLNLVPLFIPYFNLLG